VSNLIRQIVRNIPPLRKLYYSHVGESVVANTDTVAHALRDGGFKFDQNPDPADPSQKSFGLQELGEQYLPTKRLHNYLLRYDHVFGPTRHDVKRMVEIGVQTDTSVRMWRDYFPNAEMVGIDIDPECKRFESDRIKIAIGDQTDTVFLSKFAREYFGKIDIIVDDGIHSPQAIKVSFEQLYPALSAHGVYAVEDVVNHHYVPALVASITAAINYWPANMHTKLWQILDDFGPDADWFARHTIGLEFYRHILFVKRGFNPRDNPFIMDKAVYYGSMNNALKQVADAKAKLRAEGKAVNAESLISVVGFQHRYYVYDFLSGVVRFEYDEKTGGYSPRAE
jgi:hypothetical protein